MAGDLWDHEREELERVGEPLGLTIEEVQAARAMQMSPERYAAFKGVRSIDGLRAAVKATSGSEAA